MEGFLGLQGKVGQLSKIYKGENLLKCNCSKASLAFEVNTHFPGGPQYNIHTIIFCYFFLNKYKRYKNYLNDINFNLNSRDNIFGVNCFCF